MENFHNIFTKAPDSFSKYLLPGLVGVVGLLLIGYGLIALSGMKSQSSTMTFEAGASAVSTKSLESEQILVDIEGNVLHPGVYSLPKNARVQALVVAAGGFSGSTDRVWAAKSLNLAALLHDGEKIYIPAVGETYLQQVAGLQTNGLTNIKSATAQELDKLPGVGMLTAQKIIDARPFSSVQELLDRKIVSKKVFDQIQPLIIAQ